MKLTLVLCSAAALLAQTPARLGIFEAETDVGNPALKGSTEFDAAKNEYRITGGGANMWSKADEFHYVWRKFSGNLVMTANVRFLGEGAVGHRKAGLVIRRNLEGDGAYADAIVHGDGLTSLQWREAPGDITRGVNFPIAAPSRIRLERRGIVVTMWAAGDGEPLRALGSIELQLGGPVYVGLAVCSHKADIRETAVFSDVSVESLPPAPKK